MISIDLGSNTCRMLAFDGETKRVLWTFERAVKTAEDLHESGKISDAAIERIIDAIEVAKAEFSFEGALIDAVTTEAMRQASNADAVIETLSRRTGVRFRIIDAESEAAYTLKGVEYRLSSLGIAARRYALIDIGGGSTEVIFRFDDLTFSRSFPIGIVTLSQRCDVSHHLEHLVRTSMEPVSEYVTQCYEVHGRPDMLIATAGTPTTVASYLLGMECSTYNPEHINGYMLTCNKIAQALQALLAMQEQERSRYVGVGRESLILTGIAIMEQLYATMGFDEAMVIDDGLREGVALSYCKIQLKAFYD